MISLLLLLLSHVRFTREIPIFFFEISLLLLLLHSSSCSFFFSFFFSLCCVQFSHDRHPADSITPSGRTCTVVDCIDQTFLLFFGFLTVNKMIRSSSLKRGRIEGNDAVDNPTGAGHDNKRVRRTISDERNKKPERSVSFEGIPLQRSISVGTYERGIAMGRKRRNSNYAIPEILAPWLKGQRNSSVSTFNDASSNAVETTDSYGKAYSFSTNASKPRIQVANTRTRALSSFDLTKDEGLPAGVVAKGSGKQEGKERRDRVVSFGFVTAAEALGDTKLADEKSSVNSSIVSKGSARQFKRSFSAPVDAVPQQLRQAEKVPDERKGTRSAEVTNHSHTHTLKVIVFFQATLQKCYSISLKVGRHTLLTEIHQ